MSDDQPVQTSTGGDPQAEVLAALSARLERPLYPDAVIPTESQLFRGYLVLEGGIGYFLCQRFGRWEVHTEFDASTAKGVEVTESFGGSGFEVRLLDRGNLVRFGGLDEATARRVVATLAGAGGEGREPRKHAKAPARPPTATPLGEGSAIVRGGSPLAASPGSSLGSGPALSFGGSAAGVALGGAASASLGSTLGRLAAAAERRAEKPAKASGGAWPSPAKEKEWAPVTDDDEEEARGDDDDDFEADDDDDDASSFEQDPDVAAALAALEAESRASAGSAGGSARTGAEALARAKAQAEAKAKAGPKVRPILRMIAALIFHTILALAAFESDLRYVLSDLAGDPDVGLAVYPTVGWMIFAAAGGLGSGSLGRGLAMLFYGLVTGVALFLAGQEVHDPWVLRAIGWFIVGWGYLRTREADAQLIRAALTTVILFVFAGALDASSFGDGAIFVFAAFWLAHYLWERLDSVGKKSPG